MSNTLKLNSVRENVFDYDYGNNNPSNSQRDFQSVDYFNNIKICFFFSSGSKLTFNYYIIKDCCLILNEEKIRNSQSMTFKYMVPDNVTDEELKDYIKNSKNKEKLLWNYSFEIIEKVFIICEFFKNYGLLRDLILNYVNPNLNFNNAINLLDLSFQKLSSSNKDIKDIYFKLFYETINFISKNFIFFLERLETTLIKINKKILEEIISKFLQLVYNDLLTESVEKSHYDNLIKIIFKLRDMTSIFDLLVHENFRTNSEENIIEIDDLKPVIVLNINKDITNSYYKETEQIIVEKQSLILNYFYNKNDDLFSVNLKSFFYQSGMSGFFPVTIFSTAVYFKIENQIKKNYQVISLTEKDKIFHNIFSIQNFSKSFKNSFKEDTTITLSIHIKICFIHSMILNYLLFNLKNACDNSSICKISKNDLLIIFNSKLYTESTEDQLVKILIISDQINVNENVRELIELINWKSVSFDVALEFTVKFYGVIENLSLLDHFKTILSNCFVNNYKSNFNNNENESITLKLQREKEGVIDFFLKSIFGIDNHKLEFSNKLDFTNQLWEINKLNKYKTLCEFNQKIQNEKKMNNLESFNFNCSDIIRKSSKNGDAEISLEQVDFDRIQLKKDCKQLEDLIECDAKGQTALSEFFEVKEKLKNEEIITIVEDNINDKIQSQPLPDSDKLNLELLDFSVCENNQGIKSPIKEGNKRKESSKEEKITKESYFYLANENLKDSKEVMKTPTKHEIFNETISKTAKNFKNSIQENSIEKTEYKINLTKEAICINNSHKSTTSNMTTKTNMNENPSKFFCYSFKKVVDNYSKIKEKINEKTKRHHQTRIKMMNGTPKAYSLSNILKTNPNNTSGKQDQSINNKANNKMVESFSKHSAFETFVSTVPLKSSLSKSKLSVNISLNPNYNQSKQNSSFKESILHLRNFSNHKN